MQFPTLRLASSPTGRARLRSHRARRFAHLAKYNVAHSLITARARTLPGVRPWLLCVPRTPPWPHLAKYNVARWPFTARARTPGRSAMASLRPPDAAMASPSQVQCCTLAVYGPGAQSRFRGHKRKTPHVVGCFPFVESGSVLLSRAVTSQVPSALKGLTSVFGMGTGGSLSP